MLETKAARRVQENLTEVRNRLKAHLEEDPNNWNANRLAPVIEGYLREFEAKGISSLGVEGAINQGVNNGRLVVAETARIPKDSNYFNWSPVLPINSISLLESKAASDITKVSAQVKDQILRKVQVGLALGAPVNEIADDILGVGLKGSKGRDGVFRSASVRAETIARTVSNDLINEGALITYNGVDQVTPELDLKKIWQTLSDRRTSKRCLSLSGQVRGLKEEFNASDGWAGEHPSAHPNCRSRITVKSEPYNSKWESRWPSKPISIPKPPVSIPVSVPKPTVSTPLSVPVSVPKKPRKNAKKSERMPEPDALSIPKNTVLSENPAFNDASLQAAIRSLPTAQAELIEKFLKNTDVQTVFSTEKPKSVQKLVDSLKFSGSSEHRNIFNKSVSAYAYRDDDGNKMVANGYTSNYYNHIQVRLIEPIKKFNPQVKLLQASDKKVVSKHLADKDYMAWSYSEFLDEKGPEQILCTMLHEIGHQMQHKAGFGYQGAPENVWWFTEYGDPNDDQAEWHAESFRLWAVSPELFKESDPLGYEYINSMAIKAANTPSFNHIPKDTKNGTKLQDRK